MPGQPMKLCSVAGCFKRVRGQHCKTHAHLGEQQFRQHRRYDRERPNSNQRGYNHRWRKARLTWLSRHPLCVECDRHDRITPATDVDHVVPHRGDQALFWDTGNWQSLCASCHSRKTVMENRGFGYPDRQTGAGQKFNR